MIRTIDMLLLKYTFASLLLATAIGAIVAVVLNHTALAIMLLIFNQSLWLLYHDLPNIHIDEE